MLPAVEFHNQTRVWTEKIDDVRTNFVLAAEFPTLQAPVTYSKPKCLLCIRLGYPQTASAIHV